jgi:hypothetical protein
VNDYGTLAEKLRTSGEEQNKLNRDLANHEFDSGAFFESVKAHITEEIERANIELHKRGLTGIQRVLVPCYLGRLCLTFGTILLCCVEFDSSKERMAAVILGPPNRNQISRKEYSLSRGFAMQETSLGQGSRLDAAKIGPAAVAEEIVSEILETGIHLTQKPPQSMDPAPLVHGEPHFAEFWISLASLLRSYTALHGLSGDRQAEIEASGRFISVRLHEKLLILERDLAKVTWTRENGNRGALEFTDHGTLRGNASDEAMDLVAEQWARELMHDGELPR